MSGYIGTQPVPQATQTRQTFVATAAQTSFATAGYSVGYLDTFLNGVKLQDGVDYTATNGSDIVLTVGAALDDTLEVVAYTAFEVADVYTKAETYTKAEADAGFVNISGDTMTGGLTVGGAFTSLGIDDNAAATAVTIDASGNVGIGTASASATLELNSATQNAAKLRIGRSTAHSNYLQLDTSGGESQLTAIGASSVYGSMIFSRNNGSTTSESMRIDAAGRVTTPYQPTFDVSYSGSVYTTLGTVVFDTVYTNVGGHYNTSNGRFTAPVSGSYIFYTSHIKGNAPAVITRRRFDRNSSQASNGRHLRLDEGQSYGDNGVLQSIIYCNAGDYVTVNQFAGSSYGTNEYDYFGGYLIG